MLVKFFVSLSLNINSYIMIILLELFFFYSIIKSHVWSSIEEEKETNPSRSSDIQVLSNIKYSNFAKCTCIGLDLTISFRKTI